MRRGVFCFTMVVCKENTIWGSSSHAHTKWYQNRSNPPTRDREGQKDKIAQKRRCKFYSVCLPSGFFLCFLGRERVRLGRRWHRCESVVCEKQKPPKPSGSRMGVGWGNGNRKSSHFTFHESNKHRAQRALLHRETNTHTHTHTSFIEKRAARNPFKCVFCRSCCCC